MFSQLKYLSADVVYLQEAHIRPKRKSYLDVAGPIRFFSPLSPVKHVSTVSDPNGRFFW